MTQTIKTSIIVISSLVIFFALVYIGAWYIAPGSYPRAESYEFRASEDTLIARIELFKNKNPQFKVPENFQLKDGRENYWYHIYFYYPKEKRILHTWTRGNKIVSEIAFVAIWNADNKSSNYKEINGSFWWWKNKQDKEEFEEKIINNIKLPIK